MTTRTSVHGALESGSQATYRDSHEVAIVWTNYCHVPLVLRTRMYRGMRRTIPYPACVEAARVFVSAM